MNACHDGFIIFVAMQNVKTHGGYKGKWVLIAAPDQRRQKQSAKQDNELSSWNAQFEEREPLPPPGTNDEQKGERKEEVLGNCIERG